VPRCGQVLGQAGRVLHIDVDVKDPDLQTQDRRTRRPNVLTPVGASGPLVDPAVDLLDPFSSHCEPPLPRIGHTTLAMLGAQPVPEV
jgi:hypothetical protein